MEEVLNAFINYLFTIGLLTNETVNDLVSTYQEQMNKGNNQSEESFKNDMTRALMFFLNNMNNDKLKLMSLNIILKFIENHQSKQKVKLKNAIMLSSRVNKESIWRIFKQWHRKIDTNPYENLSSQDQHSKAIHSRLETSWDKKEREDYEQCTFRPVTNKNQNRNKGTQWNNNSKNEGNITQPSDSVQRLVYERLYSDKDKYKLRKELLALKVDNNQSVNAPFSPKIIDTPTKLRYKPVALFHDRQKSFASFKSKNRDRIKAQVEREITQNLTFSPQINKSVCSNKTEGNHTPNYLNLNTHAHDNYKRNQKSARNNTEFDAQMNNSINSLQNSKKTVDYSKIEQLYASYKEKKIKTNKIQKEMEDEQGVTFKPEFQNKDSIYHQRVNTSFHERNQKFIQHKKAFADINHQTEIQQIKERQIGYKQYTKEEKEIIAQKIIQRLYKPEYVKQNAQKKAETVSKPAEASLASLNRKENKPKERSNTNLDSYLIEGLPSNDLIKSQSNDQEDYEKPKDVKQILSTNYPQYSDGVIKDNPYFSVQRNDNEEEEEKLIGMYNDKIISMDEYTFGKNKKKQKEFEANKIQQNDKKKSQSEDIGKLL